MNITKTARKRIQHSREFPRTQIFIMIRKLILKNTKTSLKLPELVKIHKIAIQRNKRRIFHHNHRAQLFSNAASAHKVLLEKTDLEYMKWTSTRLGQELSMYVQFLNAGKCSLKWEIWRSTSERTQEIDPSNAISAESASRVLGTNATMNAGTTRIGKFSKDIYLKFLQTV